ncbi:MAG: GDSL-type esterase/lipase family protein [Crocinitomicaceae bacterium]|nr:GDSL-type esterase/lipase family protein [Crocinitomicaceae bacterium]
MKKIILSLGVITALLLVSCKKENTEPKPQSTSINKIMPLGASRVEGDSPSYESYRYELWKKLLDGNYTFDYIGTMSDQASHSDYNGQTFDVDHEGRGGWTSSQILAEIEGWLTKSGAPDIVLLSSPGGNDALNGEPYSQAISNVNAIIDKLQAANPNVTIIIEQMAPAHSSAMTSTLTSYLDQMQTDIPALASQQSTSISQVIVVDMQTGFSDSFLADDVHYNAAGANFIASRYFDALTNVLE